MKFTRSGFVKIVAAYEEEKELLKIHVIDNGKGISQNEMNKLFKMFGKLKRTAQENDEGIGMGLMICKHLVEMNQGAIEVHSDGKDQGSTFTFTMKMQQVDAKRKNMIGYFADKNDETSKQIDGDSS